MLTDHPTTSVPDSYGLVKALACQRLLVVGDIMLDEYVSGDARRVCPEAPVPVIEALRRWSVPGGAANAAANVARLGGKVVLGGVTGDDYAATELMKATRAAGIEPSGFISDPARPTTAKLRVLARGQQVTRVDTESKAALPAVLANQLAKWAETRIAEVDGVLLSDYGKGVFDDRLAGRVIAAANQAGKPVIVDPKGTDGLRYRGATVVKPNLEELAELTGCFIRTSAELVEAGQRLAHDLSGTWILVTRGAEGMALFRAGRPARLLNASPARHVYDVTGAGDTAAAALSLALGGGLPMEAAARVANAAAGVAVSKVGTSTVTPDELLTALHEAAPEFAAISREECHLSRARH